MKNENIIHDLAVAYAQVSLQDYRIEHPECIGYDEEKEYFIKAYLKAHIDLAKLYDDIEVD